ncbi:methylcytosine dioxygenase TET3 isoform X2 [Parasteatoda tepidariorum]|uniref:methylcytosine dioxygenase TET3 isoform X2 n=1 Tax=Parasteatoda tepidariorum TaxID=114398 RepID=UPI001C722609|nr:uncharacterized protein LOC107446842 isoform X2 [Parasteatoda tepidariorum]
MSMNEKNRHVSVPQPLPPSYGPPVPPVGPGPGGAPAVGQQPWMPNPVHPSPYHMPHQGFPANYKNNAPVRAPGYPPPMHHAGFIQRYPAYDAQCQSFPFGKIHEGPVRPPTPSAYPIVRHYNSQHPYSEPPKDSMPKNSLDGFPQSKSPGQNVSVKEQNHVKTHEKNGRDDVLSSPSDGKSDSETNHTTTESCPDDTRSPTSCDKQEHFYADKSESSIKSVSDSNSHMEKCKTNNNSDTNDSQTFPSINSNNQAKKDLSHAPYEMRLHGVPYQHNDNMYGMIPDSERRMHNNLHHNPNMSMNSHHMSDPIHFGYRGHPRGSLNDVDKYSDMDFSEKSNPSENVFQVPSISSTTPPKIFPPIPPSPISESWEDAKYYQPQEDADIEKVPRKKRKRCGECPGCLQKQNCGRCGPCRSVRSHQICKMRKCESLKTKKEKAAEEALKSGRRGRGDKDRELLKESSENLRNSTGDISGKINGGPQTYLSQSDSQSPSNTTMHLGNQGARNYMDQYQPQGGNNYQPPGMLNNYNSNASYGSYTPQVPLQGHPQQPMFENRVAGSIDGLMEIDGTSTTHRMTNNRLKNLIHNRQNQRDQGQLIPISNPVHDSSFNSPVPLSPVNQQPSFTSPYLPPLNHQEPLQNSLPYTGTSDSSSSLMHLQQLSPNSIEPSKPAIPNNQNVPWPETPSRNTSKTPESTSPLVQKSPVKPSQNGVADVTSEVAANDGNTVVNDIKVKKPDDDTPSNNCALDTSSEKVDRQNSSDNINIETDKTSNTGPVQENKVPANCDNPAERGMLPPPQSPTSIPRYPVPNSSFVPPPYAYRHLAPHQTLASNVPLPQGCMPPPSIPPAPSIVPHSSINGGMPHSGMSMIPNPVSNETNCDESNQPHFLWNTTTSMNTYTNITSTYNSKLSFSNATCMPTFALTSGSNSAQTYASSNSYYNSQQLQQSHLNYSDNITMLPKGGGTSKSYIDSGRIQDSFTQLDTPHNYGHQDLPHIPNSVPPFLNNYSNYAVKSHPGSNCSTPVASGFENQELDSIDRLEKLRTNAKIEPPQCDCLKNKDVLPSEKLPYYTHLGSGSSVSAIRELIECRSGEKGNAIRIEKLLYSGKEGKTSQGCPLAKWVIRRSSPEEKYLTVIRHRPGHTCRTAYIIVAMVAWEGVSQHVADMLYKTVVYKTVNFGIPTQRKCGTNEMRTCACQGLDPESCGASFSFGCSWSMYYNGCKFARSKNARKFKLTEKDEEKELEDKLQNLATDVSQLYRRMAPESFENQLVTLTKHRGWEKPEDEQLHVLPLYVIDSTDEFGSKEGQDKKIASGALEVLQKFPVDFRIRTTPLKPCKTRGRKPKDGYSPRKQAIQTAFRQLIASGKLRRIDPPYDRQKALMPSHHLTSSMHCDGFVQPDSSATSKNNFIKNLSDINNRMIAFEHVPKEETACKFYAGKHISHTNTCGDPFYSNYSVYNQAQPSNQMNTLKCNFDNNHNIPISNSYASPVPSNVSSASNNISGVSVHGNIISAPHSTVCSKLPSDTYVTSSVNASNCNQSINTYSSNNNCSSVNHSLTHGTPYPPYYPSNVPQTYIPHSHDPYHSYHSNSQPCDPNHNPYFQNKFLPWYHGQQVGGYVGHNVPLKIPGNYNASSSYNTMRLPHSNNYHNMPYSGKCGTFNYDYCEYSKPEIYNVPEKSTAPENQSNYNNFEAHQNQHFSPLNVNNSSTLTPFSPDGVYALRDMDSKSVNCFTDCKPSINLNAVKKECSEGMQLTNKPVDNQCQRLNQPYDNYNFNAKNYNYHLQQVNFTPGFNNLSDVNCNYPSESNNNGMNAMKEGYERDVKDNFMSPMCDGKDSKLNRPYSDTSEIPHCFPNSQQNNSYQSTQETNHLGVLTSKYSTTNIDDADNLVDSTTLTIEGDEVYEGHSDNEGSFKDAEVGGVAIALTHGSVLFECAKHELHATTAVKKPNRKHPTRISLVFYQHKQLNAGSHGEAEWDEKMKEKRTGGVKNLNVSFDMPQNKKHCLQSEDEIMKDNAPIGLPCTNPTTSWVTVFSLPPLTVGAPYRN